MGCVLGLDYGRRRIGVAISDDLELTAQPVGTWNNLKWKQVVDRIRTLIEDKGIERVVVGFPLNLHGQKGPSALEVERFVDKLKQHVSIPIILWDERFTSVQSKRTLRMLHQKPSQKKEKIDLIASILLLQNYLDHQKEVTMRDQGEGN
ncbi:Holliday junction resolvase RuvX [bacterium]|nr:Holliday junction resolvase RuvX [bacterium]